MARGLTAPYLLLQVGLPLLVGGGVYLAWRDESLLMFGWVDLLGVSSWLEPLRSTAAPLRPSLPDWLLFSVPDGAWVYACVAFFGRLWREGPLLPMLAWTALCPALAVGGELAQLLGWLPGTWDPADVLCYGLAGGVACFFALVPGRADRAIATD